eukprot:scaffold9956_cov114-Isochrysis_galbana.AAC.1
MMTDPRPTIHRSPGARRSRPDRRQAPRTSPPRPHTGGVPSDKALSDTRGRSWTNLVQSPDVAAGASSCKGSSLAASYSPYTTFWGHAIRSRTRASLILIDGALPAFSPSPPPVLRWHLGHPTPQLRHPTLLVFSPSNECRQRRNGH